jgi:thiamine-monophosphate kinase
MNCERKIKTGKEIRDYRTPMDSEFSVIQQYFSGRPRRRADVVLGIGDDCALLAVPAGKILAVSLDMLVENVHFFAGADAESLGHKALAVNLSDLAAQGAEPAWVTLGLAMPRIDPGWLDGFCRGFFALAERFDVQLVGGDTTRGALTIAIQAHGFVERSKALRRSGACPGDALFVTGTPGDAALALQLMGNRTSADLADQQDAMASFEYLQARLERPTPRIEQGLQLAGLASAAIDISDGLAQDLGHILHASQVGACLQMAKLPLSAALLQYLDIETAWQTALTGGDDYELCFTVPAGRIDQLQYHAAGWDCRCTRIGTIEAQPGLRLLTEQGDPFTLKKTGYDHFTS